MNFDELDRYFDECAERLLNKKPLITPAYDADPLAADHFLFQKSWAYFRERVNTIENQWKDILGAKDQQCEILKQKADALEKRLAELELEVKAQESFDEQLVRLRLGDFKGFEEDAHKMKVRWEEEREAFARTIHRLEDGLAAARAESEARVEAQAEGRQELQWKVEDLRAEVDKQVGRQNEIQREWTAQMKKQLEESESLKAKNELIRQERDRLAHLLRDAETAIQGLTKDLTDRSADLQQSANRLHDKEQELALLRERFDIVQKEKLALQNMWDQEKAEWRELWDRARGGKDPS